MISDRGGDQKKLTAKWKDKIGKSSTLSKLFTKVIKSQWGGLDPGGLGVHLYTTGSVT